jgi:plastocyanin
VTQILVAMGMKETAMDRRRRLVTAIASVTIALGLATGAALAADRDVTISGFAYSPDPVTINVGDTVTWTNDDAQAHTATGNGWNTGDLGNGESGSVTFQAAGTFEYMCGIHPAMRGTVVVRPAGGTTPPTDTDAAPITDGHDWLSATLAFLGVVMLVGTVIADRRFRDRRTS